MRRRGVWGVMVMITALVAGCGDSSPPVAGPQGSATGLLQEFNQNLVRHVPHWKGLLPLLRADSADEERLLGLLQRYANTAEVWELAAEKLGPHKMTFFARGPILREEVTTPASFASRETDAAKIKFNAGSWPVFGRFERVDGRWWIDVSTFQSPTESPADFARMIELVLENHEPTAEAMKEGIRSGKLRSYDEINREYARLRGAKS
jgi:hypothetical protein